MNVDHLKLFVRISATHNISLAGKDLNLSPAVSSSYINKLEETLGVKLIHRTTRKVSLTEEGKAFLPHAEDVLNSVATARAAVGSGTITPQGTLRLTAPASFSRMHIIPALKEFSEIYPDLKIDFRMSDSIVDLVEGGFDVAIRNASLNDSTLVARKLAADKRLICASPAYLKQHLEPKTPEDLLKHQCINLSSLDYWLFDTPEGEKKIRVQGALRVDNGESVRDACIAGMGIIMTSSWCAYQAIQEGRLVQILKDYPILPEANIWAVYPSSRLLAPKVRAFIDYFTEYFGDVPYWENDPK